jgi:hypothetical protein
MLERGSEPDMPENSFDILFVDTSSLRSAGFRNRDPDFQKLLLRSKARSLRIVVAEVAWEEWRTQMRDSACKKVREIRTRFEELKAAAPTNLFLGRLPPPALAIWGDADIDAVSKTAMAEYAAEHRIEIIPMGSDHGERTWRRYFHVTVEPPFNPASNRENRRKDIPDSWIFEVAVDLIGSRNRVASLCGDENLAAALGGIGVRVFRKPAQVVEELERVETPAVQMPASQSETTSAAADPLTDTLSAALDSYRDHERKVLGFVASFGTPSKERVADLLNRSGVAPEITRNAADRLVMSGLLRDTGHHYLVPDKELALLAKASVEDEIIKLLQGGPSNGL